MMLQRQARRNAIKLEGERSSALDLARGRLVLISAFFALAYILLAARAFDLMIIQGGLNEDAAFAVSMEEGAASVPVIARADIVDRNGVLLAATLKTASLFVDTRLISDPKATAQGLVKIFPDLAYGDVLQKLQSGKRFVWIKRGIMPEAQYAVLGLGQPGLEFRYEDKRVYPQGALGAHMVGYTDIDNRGQAGIERGFEGLLSAGTPLALSIDIRLQHALHREVSKVMKDFTAKAGAGVIMDVATGEVLAGVSLPDFDPHEAGNADKDEIFNRLTLGVYELGSVFKIFSTAALFETKNVPMSTTFDAREPIKRGRFTINDYHAEKRILTIPEVFMHSSNIGSGMMGEAVGTQALQQFYRDLGLLTPLEFEVREITPPLVPSPWRDINTLTAAYGHGIAVSPLQLTAAVATVVNGGFLVKPTLVLPDTAAQKTRKSEEVRILSPQTSHRMRQLMRLVVTQGTGATADVPGYRVGGKTGTAEKPGLRGYDRKRLISSFVGMFPADDPRYVVFVMVDEPKGTKASFGYATGGWTAAPAVARVISAMAAILSIEPRDPAPGADISDSLTQYVTLKKGQN